jgi:S-DNA-T family DNA segregation ATPase FtsK/SpoIIIE
LRLCVRKSEQKAILDGESAEEDYTRRSDEEGTTMASRALTRTGGRTQPADWRAALRRSLARAGQLAGAAVLGAATLFLSLALVSYTQTDPSLSTARWRAGNWMGLAGAYTAERAVPVRNRLGAVVPMLYAFARKLWRDAEHEETRTAPLVAHRRAAVAGHGPARQRGRALPPRTGCVPDGARSASWGGLPGCSAPARSALSPAAARRGAWTRIGPARRLVAAQRSPPGSPTGRG